MSQSKYRTVYVPPHRNKLWKRLEKVAFNLGHSTSSLLMSILESAVPQIEKIQRSVPELVSADIKINLERKKTNGTKGSK